MLKSSLSVICCVLGRVLGNIYNDDYMMYQLASQNKLTGYNYRGINATFLNSTHNSFNGTSSSQDNRTNNYIINDDFNSNIIIEKLPLAKTDLASVRSKNLSLNNYDCYEPIIIQDQNEAPDIGLSVILRLAFGLAIALSNLFWLLMAIYRIERINRNVHLKSQSKSLQRHFFPDYGLQLHSSFLGTTYGILFFSIDLHFLLMAQAIVNQDCLWWSVCSHSRQILDHLLFVYFVNICLTILMQNVKVKKTSKRSLHLVIILNLISYTISGALQLIKYIINRLSDHSIDPYDLDVHTISKPPYDCFYELLNDPNGVIFSCVTNLLPIILIVILAIRFINVDRYQTVLFIHSGCKIFKPFKINLFAIMFTGIIFCVVQLSEIFMSLITMVWYDSFEQRNADTVWLPIWLPRTALLLRQLMLILFPMCMCQYVEIIKNFKKTDLLINSLKGEKFVEDVDF